MTAPRWGWWIAIAIVGCEGAAGTDAGPPDAGPPPPYTGEHTFPALELDPFEERRGWCLSWTLNNETDLWVNGVVMDADEGWHHSNWAYVPETAFDGPDGAWRCVARGFHELTAAAEGGAAFYAQSTQARHEEQRFPAGTAFRIPARSRVVGSVHVLNPSEEPLSTSIRFQVETLEPEAVERELHPLVMDDRVIEIPARGEAEATMDCLLGDIAGAPLDFAIHYALPHYHDFGTGLRVTAIGGPRDGEVVFETASGIGDPLGGPVEPGFALMGAQGLRLTCSYVNLGDEPVAWGEEAADEMCTVLLYTDFDRVSGGFAVSRLRQETDGRILRTVGDCVAGVEP